MPTRSQSLVVACYEHLPQLLISIHSWKLFNQPSGKLLTMKSSGTSLSISETLIVRQSGG